MKELCINTNDIINVFRTTIFHSLSSFAQIYHLPKKTHRLSVIPAWVSNYMHNKVWGEITYPFLNFNSAIIEVWITKALVPPWEMRDSGIHWFCHWLSHKDFTSVALLIDTLWRTYLTGIFVVFTHIFLYINCNVMHSVWYMYNLWTVVIVLFCLVWSY